MRAEICRMIVHIKNRVPRRTLCQQSLRVTFWQTLQSSFMLLDTGRNSRPIREEVKDLIKQEQEIPQLVAGSLNFDRSRMNRHESAGEDSTATNREVRANKTECTDFNGNPTRCIE